MPARCAEGLRDDLHGERVGVGGEAAARRQLQLLGYIARVAQAGAEHEKVVEALSPGAAGENENERKNAEQTKMTKHVKALPSNSGNDDELMTPSRQNHPFRWTSIYQLTPRGSKGTAGLCR